MAFASSTDLLGWLSQNYFLNQQQVDDLRGLAVAEPNAVAFCKDLLGRDWLTPFQVNQLLKHGGDTLIIGANRLQSRIGEGSMGQVFKAWNIRLGRMVAVKMLHADNILSTKAMDRFRREMQTASQLDHPNIVLVRDADEHLKCPYLVMDFIEGIDLSRLVKQSGPMPVELATEYCRQAALGLQHAYERGIVHRDIKPSNLFLTRGSPPVVKILDFGLAKFEREEGDGALTQLGRLLGTVDFIAPEQARDAHTADIRSDIYSLGCTLFYLATGRPAFNGNDQMEKITARLQGDPPRLREFRPDASAAVDAIVFRMMAREPSHRYQTPVEVAQAFALAQGAVAAPPPVVVPVAAPIVAKPVQAVPVRPAPVQALPEPEVFVADDVDRTEPEALPFQGSGTPYFGEPDEPRAAASRSAPSREAPAPKESSGLKGILVVLVACVVMSLMGVIGWLIFGGDGGIVVPPPQPLGTLEVSLDSPPVMWEWYRRKPIIVVVKRKNCQGTVVVQFDNPPDWVTCNKRIMGPGETKVQLDMTIKGEMGLEKATLKIVAKAADSEPGYVELPFTIQKQ